MDKKHGIVWPFVLLLIANVQTLSAAEQLKVHGIFRSNILCCSATSRPGSGDGQQKCSAAIKEMSSQAKACLARRLESETKQGGK